MLTGMTEKDWEIAVEVFRAVRSKRGEPGRDDRKTVAAIVIMFAMAKAAINLSQGVIAMPMANCSG